MIEGLKMIEHEKVNTMEKAPGLTDIIRDHNQELDSIINRMQIGTRTSLGENAPDEAILPEPSCLMDDVVLLGKKIGILRELCDIIGRCV